ncbi:MAG TPA: diaminopimelate epimerase [Planctomycetota bacterium]|nr:diaminopimelate epimerase [Planctomycetota bacterium]
MKTAIPFVKMSGTGNDFIMIDNRAGLLKEGDAPLLAKAACPRRVSVGADGVILIEKPSKPGHDLRMRIFNADGSEAEMCGNGSRCFAIFAAQIGAAGREQKIDVIPGTLNAVVAPDGLSARVQLSQPSRIEKKTAVKVFDDSVDLYFVNTGVPHAIQFVVDVSKIDIRKTGACIRYHDVFKPKGANANFAQLLGNNTIRIRTYERGVEDETLACGTGATAAAIASAFAHGFRSPVKVLVAGGALTIHFELNGDQASRPYLEGGVDTVYKGEYFWR